MLVTICLGNERMIFTVILAFAAYMVIITIASGSLYHYIKEKSDEKYFDGQNAAAWGFAMLSTFALPWGGVPLSNYLGVGSWTWFMFAGISLCISKNDGRERNVARKFCAIANVAVITAFMMI
jgi:hypothetical protein